jgi:receptor protein-tyrosine kinase
MTDKPESLHLIQRLAQRLGEKNAKAANGTAPPQSINGFGHNGETVRFPGESGTAFAQRQVQSQPEKSIIPSSGDNGRTVRLDLAQMRRHAMVTPDSLTSQLSNEYRSIKRKILRKARDPQTRATVKNLVMITSAVPKEGKTFTAINLAMSLAAERGLSVLLVDGDVVRPSVHSVFRSHPDVGLLDLLSGKVNRVADVTYRCADQPNLSVIFSGRPVANSPELVSSARMLEVCNELASTPDRIVVIDTPPVLGAPEAAALAPNMHQAIVVVASDQADRHQLRRTLDSVSTCRSISLLFNKAPSWHEVDYAPYYYQASKGSVDQKTSHDP